MAQTAQLRKIDHAENEAQRVFALQRAAYLAHPYPTLEERKGLIKRQVAGFELPDDTFQLGQRLLEIHRLSRLLIL